MHIFEGFALYLAFYIKWMNQIIDPEPQGKSTFIVLVSPRISPAMLLIRIMQHVLTC